MKDVTLKQLKEEIAKGDTPLFVKFHTSWCGVCRVNAPIIAQVEKNHPNDVRFVAVDADSQKTWEEDGNSEFKIQLVPTYLIYLKGKLVWRQQNFVAAPVIEQALANLPA